MFQFPVNPVVGQTYSPSAGITFRWNGTAWYLVAGASAFITQDQADARYLQLANLPQRNVIIGGDFSTNPWQRGVTFAPILNNSYAADRFFYNKVGTMVHTITKSADAPTVAQAGQFSTDCALIDCTTAQAVLAAGDFCIFAQGVEGFNWMNLAQRPMVLTFWHKHTKTGTYCVSLRNGGADRSIVLEYQQAVSDVWEKATIAIPASPSAGTWNYNGLVGLTIAFALAAGTTWQAAAGAWTTGNFFTTANQVNACDNAVNNFRLALIQLEAGSIATPFEWKPVHEVFDQCRRYFQSYNGGAGFADSAAFAMTSFTFPIPMRATPTIVAGVTLQTARSDAGTHNPSSVLVQGISTSTLGSVFRFGNYTTLVSGKGITLDPCNPPSAFFNAEY